MIDTMGPLLSEFCDLKSSSGRKNKAIRFLDMNYSFFSFGIQSDKLIIDLYSTSAFYFAFYFSQLARVFRIPYIVILHGGNLPARFQSNRRLMNLVLKSAQHIVAPSSYLAEFFIKNGLKVKTIPNFIELENYKFKIREECNRKIIALRGFNEIYNPLMTVKAFEKVRKLFPDAELLLIGNKDEGCYEEIKNYISNGGIAGIELRNKMSRAEWTRISENYDIMVSNPIIDNTPVSLIEGLALGICIISTNVGGIPKLFSNEVIVMIENRNIDLLANEICHLFENNRKCKDLSLKGREFAEKFAWSALRKDWEQIILN